MNDLRYFYHKLVRYAFEEELDNDLTTQFDRQT